MSTANAKHAENRRKLTRTEKKEIAALIRAAKGDGKAHTAQQTIPYLAMYPDGICKVTEKKYSKSIAYDDINYQLAQADDKTAIFENWCDFLNYFDATVSVQLSFINRGTRSGGAKEVVAIPAQNDAFNSIRTEYADMLKHQLAKGNNGFVKSKYITFSVEADNLNAAKARLARIETDILNNFKVLGAAARPMTGYERLEALHSVFHPEGEPFRFSWDWLTPSGLTTKDFIAPSSFRFGEGRYFRMGRKIGAVSFLEILAPELNDRMLADILDLETGIVVNLHIKSIDQTEAIKTIKRKITDLDKMKIEEQKKAVRSGYDMDIIPSDLAMFGGEAKNLLQDLQSRNERMFLLTFLVVNMADTKRKLENDIFAAAGIAQKYNCALTRLDYQQEAGLMSSVPLGENLIPIQRGLTTSSTAIFIPFITQELFQQGAALYYGLNALSSNMILCDRKRLKNPNGLILGTPGSGKSFAAKREITNAFLITDDDIIICDPEAEYYPLVRRLHGQVIRISPTSTQYVNPMDTYTVEVPYNYYILNVTLTNRPISSFVSELLTPEQLEMYRVYLQTSGNKPLVFGGGSADTSASEDLSGVTFVNGTRPGNTALVDIAKSQVGNVGGAPYWSWYGFNSRVAWCACFVSWCYGQAGLSEPRFAGCQSQGVPWFTSHGQWGARGYENIAPGDAIFFDWDLDGSADHVGIVIGTDGSRVYTVEGNSGDACKIRSYPLDYACIKGYGLMNWN